MNYRVAAYITSYEDSDALLRCVTAIRNQSYPVEEILVIENSAKDHVSHLNLDKLIVEHHPENIGISGGLRIAISWLLNQGYDFLWTFDQDSEPDQECLANLLRHYDIFVSSGHRIGILAPKVIDTKTDQVLNGITFNGYRFSEIKRNNEKENFYECDAVITSGSLVESSAARNSELPNPDLFIDAVDWDYCHKLREGDYKITVIYDAILMHRYGNSRLAKNIFTKKVITINNYSRLRYFYISRNHTYVETRLCRTRIFWLRSIIYRLRCLVIFSVKIIFYERENVSSKIWSCFSGTYHGLIGNLSKKII